MVQAILPVKADARVTRTQRSVEQAEAAVPASSRELASKK
jgi:hypothetical protein